MFKGLAANVQLEHEEQVVNLMDIILPSREPVIVYVRAPGTRAVPGNISPRRHRAEGHHPREEGQPDRDGDLPRADDPPPPADLPRGSQDPAPAQVRVAGVIDLDAQDNIEEVHDVDQEIEQQREGRRSIGVQTREVAVLPRYRFVVRIPTEVGDMCLELTDGDLKHTPIEQLRPMDIELALFEVYPYQLRAYDRLCLVDGDRALRHLNTLLEQQAVYTTYKAIPSVNTGATNDDGYTEALGLVGRSPAQLKKAQTRLLLQGEPGLIKKVLRAKGDFAQIKAVMHAAAGRYSMQLLSATDTAPSPSPGPNPTSSNLPEPSLGQWQTVKGRASRRATSAPPARREKVVQVNEEVYTLKDTDWDVPVRAHLKAGEDGVLLVQSVPEAARMTRTLAGTPNRYALVTLQPLNTALSSQAITFRATTLVGPHRQIHDKILTGYLNQFGSAKVDHRWQIKEVDIPKGSTATTVLLAKVKKDIVSDDDWEEALKLKDVRNLNAHILQDGLVAVACFHDKIMTNEGVDELHFKIRVRVEEVDAYMRQELPFTINPMGDAALAYSVIWDRSCSSLQDLRARFADLPGYRGPVYSRGGVGVRVLAQHRDAALQILGRPSGRQYLVQGLPLDIDHEAVQRCMHAIPWDGEVISTFRRVVKGAANFKVRAGDPPPQEVLRVRFGDQQCTLRIQAQGPPTRLGKEATKPAAPVRTWAEAARRAIGLQQPPTVQEPDHTMDENDVEFDEELSDNDVEETPQDGDDLDIDGGQESQDEQMGLKPVSICTPRPKRKSRTMVPDTHVSGRLDHLEGSLHELRSLMTQLLHRDSGTAVAGSAPKRQCPTPPAASSRGSIPIPSDIEHAIAWHTVPGDGDCGWHTLATIVNDNWELFDPVETPRFKAHILQELRDIQEELANMLGCGREHIQRIIGTWAPSHTWIDARGLLAAACLHGANILIVNKTDAVIEVLSPFGEHGPDTVYWCMRYESQHYSPGKIIDWPKIARYLDTVPLKPWCPRRHLPGGSSSTSSSSFPPLADLPHHPVGTCIILAHFDEEVIEVQFVLKEHVFNERWPSVAVVNEYIRLMLPDRACAWRLCELGVPIEESRAFPVGALMNGQIHAWPATSYNETTGTGGFGEGCSWTSHPTPYAKMPAKAPKRNRGWQRPPSKHKHREPRSPQPPAVSADTSQVGSAADACDCDCGDAEEDESSDSADDHLQIATLNVGGWTSNAATVLAHLCDSSPMRHLVLAVQETNLTEQGQKQATRAIEQLGLKALWGAPAPLRRDKKGSYRTARGGCPGVGFLFSSCLSLTPIQPQSHAVRTWTSRGRVCLAWLKTQNHTVEGGILLANIYAPSGNEWADLRRQFHDDLAHELLLWGHTPSILLGDWNDDPVTTCGAGLLMSKGWQICRLQWNPEETHTQEPHTFSRGDYQTTLDGVLVSPEICSMTEEVLVCSVGLQHKCLKMRLPVGGGQPEFPRVVHPPRFSLSGSFPSPINWPRIEEKIAHAVQRALRCESPTLQASAPESGKDFLPGSQSDHAPAPDPELDRSESRSILQQRALDDAWDILMCAIKTHILSCHSALPHETRPSQPVYPMQLGVCHLNWLPRRRRGGPTDGTRTPTQVQAMRFLHRMIQCHRDCQGLPCHCKARRRMNQHRRDLSEYLGLSEDAIHEWDKDLIHGPSSLRDSIRKQAQLEREKGIKQWKANLFDEAGRPRSSIFRWLKGQAIQPHMVVNSGDTRKCGPHAFMAHMRTYWSSLMNRDAHEHSDWRAYVPIQPECEHDVQMLGAAQSRLKLDSVAGLDGWSVSAVRCVPRDALPSVLRLFSLVERLGRWPTLTTLVRLQLLPKSHAHDLVPEQFRPISIASVWYRWWSRYRLMQIGERVVHRLHGNLVGGVPGRNSAAMLMSILAAG